MRKSSISIIVLIMLAGLVSACSIQQDNLAYDSRAGTDLDPTVIPIEETAIQDQEQAGEDQKEPASESESQEITYPVVDTGQSSCFDNQFAVPCPLEGESFYGQDAQYSGLQPAYQNNGDKQFPFLSKLL